MTRRQKTAYEMPMCDWSSDVCSSDLTVEVTNRFKGLDLIDRVPEELWTEVHCFLNVEL